MGTLFPGVRETFPEKKLGWTFTVCMVQGSPAGTWVSELPPRWFPSRSKCILLYQFSVWPQLSVVKQGFGLPEHHFIHLGFSSEIFVVLNVVLAEGIPLPHAGAGLCLAVRKAAALVCQDGLGRCCLACCSSLATDIHMEELRWHRGSSTLCPAVAGFLTGGVLRACGMDGLAAPGLPVMKNKSDCPLEPAPPLRGEEVTAALVPAPGRLLVGPCPSVLCWREVGAVVEAIFRHTQMLTSLL